MVTSRFHTDVRALVGVEILPFVVLLAAAMATPAGAGVIRQLTDQKSTRIGALGGTQGSNSSPPSQSLDDAGTTVFVNASTNQLGGNPGHQFQIFSFDAATGAGQQVTHFDKGISNLGGTVSVSDDGQWLAFVSRSNPTGQNHDASPEVFVMRPNGTGLAQVTSDPAVNAGAVTGVVLSGSANRILFISNSNPLGTNSSNRIQLFVVDFDGTGLKQLTNITTSETWNGISISDDGQRIVFSTSANLTGGNADRNSEVFAIQADGTNLRQITSSPTASSLKPVISGNGSKIAFQAYGGTAGIGAINWDGTGPTTLVPASGHSATEPSITDDGQFVFFPDTAGGGGRAIWKVKTDGTGLTQLTSASSN